MDEGIACTWRELPRRKVELVVVVEGREVRSGVCRSRFEAHRKIVAARRALAAGAESGK